MGFLPVLKAFIAAVIGGLGSLSGAVAGGFFLGALEVFLQAYLPGSAQPYRDAIVLVVVIAVLMFRPNGIFSRVAQVKV
jgi:branched-chain amino acid transport system permease protein